MLILLLLILVAVVCGGLYLLTPAGLPRRVVIELERRQAERRVERVTQAAMYRMLDEARRAQSGQGDRTGS